MPQLTRRVHLLLDDERYRRLELRSRATGASVGALLREAVDIAFPGQVADRERAGRMLLDAEPVPVGDWDEIEREIETMYEP